MSENGRKLAPENCRILGSAARGSEREARAGDDVSSRQQPAVWAWGAVIMFVAATISHPSLQPGSTCLQPGSIVALIAWFPLVPDARAQLGTQLQHRLGSDK